MFDNLNEEQKERFLEAIGDVLYELAKSFEGCTSTQGIALKPEGYDERKKNRKPYIEITMNDIDEWRSDL